MEVLMLVFLITVAYGQSVFDEPLLAFDVERCEMVRRYEEARAAEARITGMYHEALLAKRPKGRRAEVRHREEVDGLRARLRAVREKVVAVAGEIRELEKNVGAFRALTPRECAAVIDLAQ